MAEPPAKRAPGRPTTYDLPGMEQIIYEICSKVSLGATLREVCRDGEDFGFPVESTFRGWVLNDTPPGIAAQYARARELQLDSWADEIVHLATTPQIGEQTETDASGAVIKIKTGDTVERSRLAVDARKWLMSKLAPKKYGERVQQELVGKDGGPLTVSWLPAPPKQ